MSTAKVSVAIGQDELTWARAVALRERKSLSAVLTESLAEHRRLRALRELVNWMGEAQDPLSNEELAEARRELGLVSIPKQKAKSSKRTRSKSRG